MRRNKKGDGGIRTRDGGFADPCLNHLATSPNTGQLRFKARCDLLLSYFTMPSGDVKSRLGVFDLGGEFLEVGERHSP